jgi:hypothetical protein
MWSGGLGPSFMTIELDGSELSASLTGRFTTPMETVPVLCEQEVDCNKMK